MPLSALKGVAPHSVYIGERWVDGFYPVSFEYRIKTSVREFAERIKAERDVMSTFYSKVNDSFVMYRRRGGVYQDVQVAKRVTEYHDVDGKSVRVPVGEIVTKVRIYERVEDFERPFAYYRRAFSERPPVPMVEVPFARRIKTRSVSIGSFDEAMSSRGISYGGNDLVTFSTVLWGSYDEIVLDVETWAGEHGYSRTKDSTWFRPGSGLFEFGLKLLSHNSVVVTLHTSEREAVHPIYRGARF